MRIRIKRVWKRVLLAGLLLPVALLILLQTSIFQQWLLRRIETVAHAAGITFSARKLDLDMWDLRASLEGVAYENSGVGVKATRVVLDVPWSIFTADIYDITYLEIDEPVITVLSDEPLVPEPSGEPTKLPQIRFQRLIVRKGSFSYANQRTPFSVPEFSADVTNNRGVLRLAQPAAMPPDLTLEVQEIPFAIEEDGLQFGPTPWGLAYTDYNGKGSAQGRLQWAPTLALDMTFHTDPLTFDQWKEIEASGVVQFKDGVLKITEFRANQGEGQLTASAEISDKAKSATVVWNKMRIDPSGIPGTTEGTLDLHWTASDFSDASGTGAVSVSTLEYGKATGDLKVDKGVAKLDAKMPSYDLAVKATTTLALNKKLSGSFEATQRRYGVLVLRGKLTGTLDDPIVNAVLQASGVTYQGVGPINASANAALRGRTVALTNVTAVLKQSQIRNASARINLDSRRITGEIPRTTLRLEDVVSDASGPVTLWAKINGTLDRPGAQFAGDSPGFDVGGTHIDSASVEGELLNNVLRVDRLIARQAEGELQGQGTLNIENNAVNADLHVSNLQITNVGGLSTTAFFDGTVGGTVQQPSTQFKGELQNVVYEEEAHGNLSIEGNTVEDTATVRVHSDKYSTDAVSEIKLVSPYPFTASIVADQSQIHYQQYDFAANGQVQASGNLEPLKVSGITAENFTLKGEGIDLTATGPMDSGMKVDFTADLAQIPVEGAMLTGTAEGHATVTGTIEEPRVEGTVQTSNATIQVNGMTEPAGIQANVDFAQDRYNIREMRADIAGGTVTVTGTGDLKGAGEFAFKADGIRPERLLSDRPVAGVVSAEGTATLTEPTLDGLTVAARTTELDFNVRGLNIQQAEPFQLSVDKKILTVGTLRLKGTETEATVGGTANLETGALNLNLNADTNVRVIEVFVPNSTADGRIRTQLTVGGTTAQPNINGFINLAETQFQLAEPPLDIRNLVAQVQFRGDRLEIVRADGDINGGKLSATGGAGISADGLRDAAIHLKAERVQLEYPEGLQGEINSDLTLAGTGSNVTLEGTVDITNALYREDIDLTEQVFSRIANTAEAGLGAGPAAAGFGEQIGLDIAVRTPGLVTVTNNVANLDLTGAFRVRGNLSTPIVLGRAAVNQGGELYFGAGVARGGGAPGERRDRYVIERGEVNFNNATRTDPSFDFEATHELKVKDERYLITLRAYGTPENLKTELTSDPPLPERDIMTMLVTGRTWTEIQTEYRAAAGEQLANYLTGEVSGFFSQAGNALGLDTVRIDPITVAQTDDLSAQLTLGKKITHNFGITFAQNLRGTRSQTWIADYDTFKNFVIRGVNESDKREVRLEFRQDLRFGGGPPLPSRIQPKNEPLVNTVTFNGSTADSKELQDKVTKPGKPFSTYRMNDDIRRLKKFFTDQDLLDVRIRPQRTVTTDADVVNVEFDIEEGPKITFEFQGADVPDGVRDDVKQIWVDGFVEAASLGASRERLLRHFRDKGFLEAKVTHRDASAGPKDRKFVFVTEEGSKFHDPEWDFKGMEAVKEPINVTDSAGEVLANPEMIRQRIEFELQKRGYLAATASSPKLIIDAKNTRFEVTIVPGPQFIVDRLEFEGNAFFPHAHLQEVVVKGPTDVIPTDQGERPPALDKPLEPFPFTATWIETARQRVTAEYWQQGFNDFQLEPTTSWDKNTGKATVYFKISEGPRQTIESVSVEGANITDMPYVLRQFVFKKGDPVDYSRINLTRKKLYDTGVFKRVEIDVVPGASGYAATVRLNEEAPWRIRYGLSAANRMQTSDRDLGLTGDITRNNLFGTAISSGVGLKALRDEKEGRFFVSFPTFLGREVRTTTTAFRARTIQPKTETASELTQNLWGLTAQQQWRLHDFYIMSYDYTYRRYHSAGPDVDVDDPLSRFSIGRFNVTLSRDTRDDILNATRGNFLSSSFEIAPPLLGLGSDFQYAKQFTQFLRFRPIKKNLVWASAVRGGVGWSFGGNDLVPTEQFLTGGATTVRAFRENNLTTEAGNAVLILNQELRFPLFWRIGGVGFFDAGNIYKNASNLKAWDLRYSPGFGIRFNTPFLLLRFDMGLNLWARSGEPPRRFVFGIGQAF